MKITQEQFLQKLEKNELIVTMIGMSNIGKSSWSKKLASEKNFNHIDIDHLLAQNLEEELGKDGYTLQDLAPWLGQPYEEKFPARQETLKRLEKELADEVLTNLAQGTKQNTVLDTPGSIIYTGAQTCEKIQANTLVIYIKASDDMLEKMVENYFAFPKPIIWNSIFQKAEGEDNLAALKRCYPLLLADRDQLYQKYADLIIPYSELNWETKNSDDFIKIVSSHL